jgi:hypothetical protein
MEPGIPVKKTRLEAKGHRRGKADPHESRTLHWFHFFSLFNIICGAAHF